LFIFMKNWCRNWWKEGQGTWTNYR